MSLVKANAPDTTFMEGGQEIVLAYNTETGKYEWAREVPIRPHLSLLPFLGLTIIIIMIIVAIIYAVR
jgi:hypothetical protein